VRKLLLGGGFPFLRRGRAGHAAAPGAAATSPTPAPAAGLFRDRPDCPDMVALPGGAFAMGSDPPEPGREAVESPATPGAAAPFALARTKVTRDDFARFVAETGRKIAPGCWVWAVVRLQDAARSWDKPGYPQAGDHPAVCVPRADAAAYAGWMSARTGQRYRLPSEAEWEYAAGGDGGAPWGADAAAACRDRNLHDAAGFATFGNALLTHFAGNDGAAATSPVGSYAPNRLGLSDMLGNVAEWTADRWVDSHRWRPASGAARQGGEYGWRTSKSGAWNTYAEAFRPALRWPGLAASGGSIYAGLRLERDRG
jgi:formylglycine-generating enzyme required for sulfatase activity